MLQPLRILLRPFVHDPDRLVTENVIVQYKRREGPTIRDRLNLRDGPLSRRIPNEFLVGVQLAKRRHCAKTTLVGTATRDEEPRPDPQRLQRSPLRRLPPPWEQLPVLEGEGRHLLFVAGVRADRPNNLSACAKGKVRNVSRGLARFERRELFPRW